MFTPIHTRTAATLVVLLVSVTVAPAQTILRYKFKEGDKLPYAIEQKMNMQMMVAGQNITMAMNQTMDMTWHVKAVAANGTATMVQTFDRIRFAMEGPMGKSEFDTRDNKEPDDPLAKSLAPVFGAMVGSEFTLNMDVRGKISDINLPKKVTEKFKGLGEGGVPGLKEMFSADGLKRMIQQSGLELPEARIDKGKSWNQKADLKMPFGKMIVETVLTYEGAATRDGKSVEMIALNPKLTIEGDENAAFQVKLKSQENKGKAYFDNVSGRLLETTQTQAMEMAISVAGMEVVQKIEQIVAMKLAESKAK